MPTPDKFYVEIDGHPMCDRLYDCDGEELFYNAFRKFGLRPVCNHETEVSAKATAIALQISRPDSEVAVVAGRCPNLRSPDKGV